MALICDTGPLYAAMDRKDKDHAACAALLREVVEPIVIPSPVIVEIEWLAADRLGPGAFDALLESILEASVAIEDLTVADYARVRELCKKYAKLRLGFVDAAVISIVERFGETKVATLDRRHFGVVRPRHARALTLLPPP